MSIGLAIALEKRCMTYSVSMSSRTIPVFPFCARTSPITALVPKSRAATERILGRARRDRRRGGGREPITENMGCWTLV